MSLWIIILTLVPIGMAILGSETNEMGLGFAVGLIFDSLIIVMLFAFTTKPTGNSLAVTDLIVEKGEFSAMIHVKGADGKVTDSLRITDAAQLDAFNKGYWEIRKPEKRNWWTKSYYSGPEFIVVKPEANHAN
jgi:hypothetical protein